ncbi:hypothetical protein [Kitasatospora sp. NPDC085464]|uniref:hypothetical protein n=1 Tax=Kitasatospora sp. NPDC085464 TaxID=3364063 RepID=UPI0037C70C99
MDARESGDPAGAVRAPARPEPDPICSRPSGAPADDSREQGDAENYAVLGED